MEYMNGLADAVIEYVNNVNNLTVELTKNLYKSNFILTMALLEKLMNKKILIEQEIEEISKSVENIVNDKKYMGEIFKGFEEALDGNNS